MKIHKEGKKIIPWAIIILSIVEFANYYFLGDFLVFYILSLGIISLLLLVIWFFREPAFDIEENNKNILAVSDGEVVCIEPAFEREYLKKECLQISVFMSVFNVHINWTPIGGEIIYQEYRKGRFLPAFIAKSSEENERSTTAIKTENGSEILIRQIAGILARRVITYKNKGDKVGQKMQLGFIRFGSRVDLFIPKDANVKVKLHQKVFGGKTVIATFD